MVKNYSPYLAIGEDLPSPIINSVIPTQLIPEIEQEITISGLYLSPETWIKIDDCETKWTELVNSNEVKLCVVPENNPGNKSIGINRHKGEDYFEINNLIAIANVNQMPETNDKGWLELNQDASLKIGNTEEDDLRTYRNTQVYRNTDGLYWNRYGWVSFPRLSWNREEKKSLDFIFYLRGNRYITFGLINENYNRNKVSVIDSVCAYRLIRYYFYGAYGNGLFNRLEYKQMERYKYYRLRINNNGNRGEKVQLFQLENKEKENWDKGTLVWEEIIPLNFIEEGNILTPIIFEYNTSSNPILAVRVL